MFERRQHPRRRTLLDGRLEVAKLNGWALECSVRNLSAGGARVAIAGDVVVPQHVGLAVSGAPQRPARLVWYRGGHAGFALVEGSAAATAFAATSRREPTPDTPSDRFAARVAAIAERGKPAAHFTRP